MSDQVKQQVMVEFVGALLPSLEKAFAEVINSVKALGSAHKGVNAEIEKTNKTLSKNAVQGRDFAAQTEKVEKSQSKFRKTLSELGKDYKKNEAGLTSVASAFGYYARGVTNGNKSIDVAKRSTDRYMAALMGTNSVLMASDKAWGSWAKTVSFKTIKDAEANGQIKLTKEGIQLMNAESWKAIGLTREQAKVLQSSALSQDLYSRKLREAKVAGGEYLKSFQTLGKTYGTSTKAVAIWATALEKADKGLSAMRMSTSKVTGLSNLMVDSIRKSSVATQILNGNLKVSGGSFKIYNEQGLRSLGITEEQAAKMKMLASTYGAYGSTLQKMRSTNDANLKSFTALTERYGKSDTSVRMINKALTETDKIISSKVLVQQNKLNESVAAGTMTRTEADRILRKYQDSLDKVGIASGIVNTQQANLAYGARQFGAEAARAAQYGKKYQDALAWGKSEHGGPDTKAYKDFAVALAMTEKSIIKTGKAMNDAGKNGDAFVATANRQKLATKVFEKELNILHGTLGNSHQHLTPMVTQGNNLAAVLEKLGTSMMNVAKYAVGAFAFYGTVGVISSVVTQIAGFDQSLKDLQAITTATDYQVELFGETIKDVARETKFSASEVADGMKNLGQAGFSAAETMVVIGDAAMLATGTLSDMATVVDLMTTTIRAYHLEATESGRLTDLFANAINRSKLTVDKLRVAFNYFASVADKANISVDDSVTLMGMLANAGVRASTIGTSLRQIIEGLVSPNKKFEDAVRSAGYTLDQFVVGELNPLEDVIRRLQKVVPDAASAFELFGIRGAPAISAITSAGVSGFLTMRESMQEAGSASKMAEIQMEGLANKAKNMKDRFELVSIALGEAGLKAALEAVVDLGRGFATFLEEFLSSAVGKVTVSIIALGSATAILNLAVKAFLGLSWVQSLSALGAAAAGSAGGVGLLTVAVGGLRVALTSLFMTPMGWAVLAAGALVAATAYGKLNKETNSYLQIAKKNKAAIDKEISLTDKKKNAANALISVLKDNTKTETQRAVALDRLVSLGIEVEGVIRNEAGAITNLDDVIKKAVPAVKAYVDELDRMNERKRAEQMLGDVSAFLKTEEEFSAALVKQKQDADKMKEIDYDPRMSWIIDDSAFEDVGKLVDDLGDNVEATGQKVTEQLNSWTSLTKEAYSAKLQMTGMSKEASDEYARNFNALDSSFFKFWYNQIENVGNFKEKFKDEFQEIVRMLDQAREQYENSPETRLKAIQQKAQTDINKLKEGLKAIDAPGQTKNLQTYTEQLEKQKEILEGIRAINEKGAADTAVIAPALGAKAAEDAMKSFAASTENETADAQEKISETVDSMIAFQDLITESQKIGLDNRKAALEVANAQHIGNEHDTANAILDIKRQQYALELKAKKEQMALLVAETPGEVEKIMKLRNDIASIEVDMAGITAEKVANVEAKHAEERERAEQNRAFKHNMNLLEIDATYWKDKNLKERETRAATISYLDEEIRILEAYKNEKIRKGQEVFDEEQKLRDLSLERQKEFFEQETQMKISQKELQEQLQSAKIDNLSTQGSDYEDYGAQNLALQMKQELERRQWAEHYENLLADKTLYGQLMYQLELKHQRERDALVRAQQSAEYAKKAEFFGELSGMMGEFYEVSNQEAVAFFYAQKALAVAEILMNTHAGAAKALGYGPFGIPMSAMIMAMGYAKAGMVMGLTVAQGVKGFADGGEIGGYSPNPRADNVPIMATAGEFMQPVAAVDYYGKGAMEAIRTRAIPREVLSSYTKSSSKSGGSRFADGGGVEPQASGAGGSKEAQSLSIVNVLDPGMFDQYMSSHSGQKTIMNVLSRNPQVIKNIVKS